MKTQSNLHSATAFGRPSSRLAWFAAVAFVLLLSAGGVLYFGGGVSTQLLGVVGASLPATLTDQAADQRNAEPKRILPVDVISVQPVDRCWQALTLTGAVVARRTSDIGFEQSGRLDVMNFDQGARVHKGDVLAALDPRLLSARRDELSAQRDQAAARLRQLENGPRNQTIEAAKERLRQRNAEREEARRALARNEKLLASQSISRADYDQSLYRTEAARAAFEAVRDELEELAEGTRTEEIEAQRASLAMANAGLRGILVQLEQSRLEAPFDGTIALRFVDEGTVVEPGRPIFRLVETEHCEAHIGLPTDLAATVPLGSEQTLELESQTITARLRTILPEVSPQTQTQLAVLELVPTADAPPPAPGGIARWNVYQNVPASGCWLPVTSLDSGARGLWNVWVVDTQVGCVESRGVEVVYTAGDRVLVTGNLRRGDRVVAAGIHRLAPRQQVRIANEIALGNEIPSEFSSIPDHGP